jgi:glucose-1-phosphate cytidylyltransferase
MPVMRAERATWAAQTTLRRVKAVILAGGLGSRLSEETTLKPKPMVEIGGMPILWHIMKIYAAHGIEEFVVCLGYKGYVIKEWFANYALHTSDVTFDMRSGEMEVHHSTTEPWRVTLVETGDETMTGGRLKRVLAYVGDETFCVTYGDGVADVDIGALVAHHRAQGRLATVTAVQPPGRFGSLEIDGASVASFAEKPRGDGAWINGGFFVCEPSVGDTIAGDATKWEEEPLRDLAARGELTVFHHRGFWQAMDTLRERHELQALWDSGSPPWCSW